MRFARCALSFFAAASLVCICGCSYEEPHHFNVSSTAGSEIGNGSFALTVHVFDGDGGESLPGSAVVVYYMKTHLDDSLYDHTYISEAFAAVTDTEGNAIFHLNSSGMCNLAARHLGYTTEDDENIILGGESNDGATYEMALYKETLNFSLTGKIELGAGLEIMISDIYVDWYPQEIQLCCSEHVERLNDISATITWNNTLLSIPPAIGDLGIGIGNQGSVHAYSDEVQNNIASDEMCSETISIFRDGKFMSEDELGVLIGEALENGNRMYFGAITRKEALNLQYSISVEMFFKGSSATIEFYN